MNTQHSQANISPETFSIHHHSLRFLSISSRLKEGVELLWRCWILWDGVITGTYTPYLSLIDTLPSWSWGSNFLWLTGYTPEHLKPEMILAIVIDTIHALAKSPENVYWETALPGLLTEYSWQMCRQADFNGPKQPLSSAWETCIVLGDTTTFFSLLKVWFEENSDSCIRPSVRWQAALEEHNGGNGI